MRRETGVRKLAMKDVTIRRASDRDARAIAEVHVAGWQWAYRGHMPDTFLDSLSVEQREVTWRNLLAAANTETRVWLAERAGRLVGFTAAGLPQDPGHPPLTAEVRAIYLLKEVAGIGIGRALLERVIEDLRQRGFRRAVLWVLASNARARGFYEPFGWQPEGATKVDPRDGFELHEIRYSIELPA